MSIPTPSIGSMKTAADTVKNLESWSVGQVLDYDDFEEMFPNDLAKSELDRWAEYEEEAGSGYRLLSK